jgi:peptidoglycan/xylan/chitin deacetylase (PgdA/CDA1 family)
MTLRFAIRDDDICFHTNSKMLHELYSDISKVCPVSFSCIPLVGGYDVDNYTPNKWSQLDSQWRLWQTREILPLGENRALVTLLKDWCTSGQATIMLHGIHHDLYEFVRDKDFTREIQEAKQYLEELFVRPVVTCSPPNNSLGKQATLGLIRNGFNILTAFGHLPKERPASVRNYLNFLRLIILYSRYGRRYRLRRTLNFGTHEEQGCYVIGPSTKFADLISGLEYALRRGGNFVVATHYYHLSANPALLEMLSDLVVFASKQSRRKVDFVTAEKLFGKR